MLDRHRGANAKDAKSFSVEQLGKLKRAAEELSWLLSKGYAMGASCELVGDRYQLTSRQRLAISRVVCADAQIARREKKRLPETALKEQTVVVDGFNLLITIETALGGGAIFKCRDGCCRDLSAVYGSYKIVAETRRAIECIGRTLEEVSPKKVEWLFDRPVSNSARAAAMVREVAAEQGWPFEAELTASTDSLLSKSRHTVISCDSAVLERTKSWCSLACMIISQQIPDAWIIDLRPPSEVKENGKLT